MGPKEINENGTQTVPNRSEVDRSKWAPNKFMGHQLDYGQGSIWTRDGAQSGPGTELPGRVQKLMTVCRQVLALQEVVLGGAAGKGLQAQWPIAHQRG